MSAGEEARLEEEWSDCLRQTNRALWRVALFHRTLDRGCPVKTVNSKVISSLCGLGFLAVSLTALFAQSDTTQVSGYIKDASGAVVPAATVVLMNESTGAERRIKTNESGYYVITSVPTGAYTVSVEATGFKTAQRKQNRIDPNIAVTIDMVLDVGAVSEKVEVVASATRIQADSASLGQVVEREQILDIQLNGRNPIFLAELKPGVRSGSSLANFSFAVTTGGFAINGSRDKDNMLYYDGAVAFRTRANGSSIGVADADSTQEVQVLTANYNAEYGRSSGGQIRIITRSGGRDFHADVFEFFRNSALDANSWARNSTLGDTGINGRPAPFRYNQFGYNVNGPVYIPGKWNRDRNKFFFLFGQEWVKYRQDVINNMTVPTLAMRQGDFSELLDPKNIFYGRARVVNDPSTGLPFPGNIVPQNMLSHNGIGLLKSFPLPTPGYVQGAFNNIEVAGYPQNQRKDTVAVDLNPSPQHQIRFRHMNYAYDYYNPFDQGSDRTPGIWSRPNKTASINYIWTISPSVVNELLVSASVDRVYENVDFSAGRADRSQYGIDYPYVFNNPKEVPNKIPTTSISNFTQESGSKYPAHSTGPIYEISDNFTKIRGNHSLKIGFLFDRAGQNDYDQIQFGSGVPGGTDNQNGRFVFTDTRTGAPTSGAAIANAALGLFDTYAEIGTRALTPYRGQMYEWFVQDAWKVTSKLRVELGLRHSIIQPYYSLWRNMIVFDPSLYDPSKRTVQDPKTGNILSGDQYNGMVIPGDGWPSAAKGRIPIADSGEFNYLFRGVPKQFADIHYKDFQPRFGVAYQMTPRQVLRAGIGKFVTRVGVSDNVFLGGQAPFQPMASIANGDVDRPGGNSATRFPYQIFTEDKSSPNPEAFMWNVTYQRELPLETSLEIAYVGRVGLHNNELVNVNQLMPGTLQKNPGLNSNYLRPYGGYYSILMAVNDTRSRYDAFEVGLTRRFTRGLSFGLAYTYSASYDNASSQGDLRPNAYDTSNLWGRSSFDTPHVMVVNFIYDLPFLKNNTSMLGKLAGGWQLAGVSQFQSGTPATISTGDDFAGVGPGSGNQIWNVNGDFKLTGGDRKFSNGVGDQNYWFSVKNPDGSSIFTAPAAGTFTTQSNRGIIRQPGFQNWNLGLHKTFRITERQRLRFQVEAFNWINHPNWSAPNTNPTAGTFGKITAKSSQRNLQFALRYSF